MFGNFNMMNSYMPCSSMCMSMTHGNSITSVMAMGDEVTDKDICAYIQSICQFCGTAIDGRRQSAPSVAASYGRTEVMRWLICKKYGKINECDSDGCTPLHRALYFGRIESAVALLKLGAQMDIMNRTATTPLDQVLFDNIFSQVKDYSCSDKCKAVVWGKNSNYTIGTSSKEIKIPEKMQMFHKKHRGMHVKQVAIEKYHAFVLTTDGSVYAYGKADGGRLGIEATGTIVEPTIVTFGHRFPPSIDKIIIQRDHNFFLEAYGRNILVCGSNEHHVLGLGDDVKIQVIPVSITKGNGSISGIATTRYHTVTWNCKNLSSWGLNGGQLGHAKEEGKYIKTQREVSNFKLPSNRFISRVATSAGATVVAVDNGDVYLLQHYICKKIALGIFYIESMTMFGGKPDNFDGPLEPKSEESRLVVITRDGSLLSWHDNDPVLSKCELLIKRKLKVVKVILHKNGFMILTDQREVYQATFGEKRQSTNRRNVNPLDLARQEKLSDFFQTILDVSNLDRVYVNLEKINRLYNPTFISCDEDGDNFAAMQLVTILCRKISPVVSASLMYRDMKRAREIKDCDYTIKVRNRTFLVDKYIIVNSCRKLKQLIKDSKTDSIEINNIDPDIFEMIIEFFYTNTCGFMTRGYEIPTKFMDMAKKEGFDDPVQFISREAKNINVNRLYKDLKFFKKNKYDNTITLISYDAKFKYKRLAHEREGCKDSYDVDIKCNDDKTLQAHRTVLEIRSDFFRSLLSTRWKDQSNTIEVTLDNPSNIVQLLLDYIYADRVDLEYTSMDTLFELLILANEILFPRLLEMCEVQLSKKITNKNVFNMISISHMHNAHQLKECCMEVICLNLPFYLDNKYLNDVDKEILLDLTKFYIRWNPKVNKRKLLPINDPVPASEIKRISNMTSINMNFSDTVLKNTRITHSRNHRRPRKLNYLGMMEDDDDDDDDMLMGMGRMHSTMDMLMGRRHPSMDMHRMRMSREYEMPSMLRSITSAMEQMKKTEYCNTDYTDYTGLSKIDYPDIGQSRSSSSSAKIKIDMPKMTKISQREKKRLSSESESPKTSLSESPKNPWNSMPSTSVGSPPVEDIISIMNNEKKQKENLTKMINKPLLNTQIEDKAVRDLKKFYNADDISDEVISVERVETDVTPASPSWVKK